MIDNTETNNEELSKAKSDFLRSHDFMKLGQAIEHGSWQAAAMTAQRMQKTSQNLGMAAFDRQFASIRQCIIHKQARQAKDILALIIAQRARTLNTENSVEGRAEG